MVHGIKHISFSVTYKILHVHVLGDRSNIFTDNIKYKNVIMWLFKDGGAGGLE